MLVRDPQHQSDCQEDRNSGDPEDDPHDDGSCTGLCVFAGEHALREVLVGAVGPDPEECVSDEARGNREWMSEIERPVESGELGTERHTRFVYWISECVEDFAHRCVDGLPDQHNRRDRGADENDVLQHIRPDDRGDPAPERVHDCDDGECSDRHDEGVGFESTIDPEDDHRERDRGRKDARARREHSSDQERDRRCFPSTDPDPAFEKLVDRGALGLVEAGDEVERDDECREDHPDVGREVGQIPAEGEFGGADEGRGGERSCNDGDRDGPDRHLPTTKEVVRGIPLLPSSEPHACEAEDGEVPPKHGPIHRPEAPLYLTDLQCVLHTQLSTSRRHKHQKLPLSVAQRLW